ncbi:class I SAM-dependent methyltransferase [Mangrovivirga sp. M17]|uniref:Class I SAM-dependent methyltransferase n=1 Tax=Mangrovivirga halotolerans TaxID=2993936 RepID=A0ABT3RSN1_9BACT|nr:class I SAM-dependent methyltransferase [Mangrovivirga halotolerans]MCX2744803.1 class I SAM-dependent methyltransferase [Mangrovivirga halotolerans]
MNRIKIKDCPICGHSSFIEVFKCKDNTVSGELFQLVDCANCKFRFTNPRPADEHLSDYYKSDTYISHSDTNEGLTNKIYKRVRDFNLKIKYKLVKKFLNISDPILLDVGAGTGYFVNFCNKNGMQADGFEPDADARKVAKNTHGFSLIDNWEKINKKYDVITMWHVLEHVPDLKIQLEKLKQILKPQGVLIIAVPNRESLDEKHYKSDWAAYDVPRHLYHFRKSDLIRLASDFNMKFLDDKPMWFDAPYVSILSEKHKESNLATVKGTIFGTISNVASIFTNQQSSKIYIFRNEK